MVNNQSIKQSVSQSVVIPKIVSQQDQKWTDAYLSTTHRQKLDMAPRLTTENKRRIVYTRLLNKRGEREGKHKKGRG